MYDPGLKGLFGPVDEALNRPFILEILPDNLEENSQTKLLRAFLLIATAPHNNPMEG